MADNNHVHMVDSRRHTAKSDQRFDAQQRRDSHTSSSRCTCSKCDSTSRDNDVVKEINIGLHVRSEQNEERNRLEPKYEMKILKHWGYLKKTIVIGHVVDPLIEKAIITPAQWLALKKNGKSDQDTVEEFLYLLLKCKHDAYMEFLNALKSRGYGHVANQLEGLNSEDKSPPTTLSSSGSNSNRQIGRPLNTNTNRMLHRQNVAFTLKDPKTRTEADHRHHTVPDEDINIPTPGQISEQPIVGATANIAVKQEDLLRMKEDITRELRHLRENIEKDRDDDRIELRILQRKHTELQDNLARTVGDREHLQKELTCVTDTVTVLKAQVEEKQNEYKEVKERNKKLEEQLEKRAGHLEILIKDKEAEKDELVKELRIKDGDYKQLQSMLERLKKEHEDRHGRLKGLTKDKITLEKEVQLLNKEKKNLEVKIKSLEQHIRTLKETHAKEIGEMKQQLDKSNALLDEKDKERSELEKRLEESVRDNENLKRRNHDLQNCLQKSQDETAHLQQKLHKTDMSKFALPPFLAGSKSTRTGWNPKNLRR